MLEALDERLKDHPIDASRMLNLAADASYGHDVTQKYLQAQAEIEKLKAMVQELQDGQVEDFFSTIRDQTKENDEEKKGLQKELSKVKKEKGDMRRRAVALERQLEEVQTEKEQVSRDLLVCDEERRALSKQAESFVVLSSQLEKDVIWIRSEALARMRPPPPIDPSFRPIVYQFKDVAEVGTKISEEFKKQRAFFVPLPPRALPLHMPLGAYGEHGYWFAPPIAPPPDAWFHLLVEGAPEQWTYLGQYVSKPFVDGEMSVAEWLCLDSVTKAAYCQRLAAENKAKNQLKTADVLTIRRKHDIGEMLVPCFYLRCVGFDMVLHGALKACLTSIPMTPEAASTGSEQTYAPRWAHMSVTSDSVPGH